MAQLTEQASSIPWGVGVSGSLDQLKGCGVAARELDAGVGRSGSLVLLGRQDVRRGAGLPTVSVLVGARAMAWRAWRQWCAQTGRPLVVAAGAEFPIWQWMQSLDPAAMTGHVLNSLARRVGRSEAEFAREWPAKSEAERERFWMTLCPGPDDPAMRVVLNLMAPSNREDHAREWEQRGPEVIPALVRIAPDWPWPAVLLLSDSAATFQRCASVAVAWAFRVPGLPIAVSVSPEVWRDHERRVPDSREKALLKEGRIDVTTVDPGRVAESLVTAGASQGAITALIAGPVDDLLLDSAVTAIRASVPPPATPDTADRARSLAERFLFDFLDSLPETAGRFELNGRLEIRFGGRPMEVDLLCRTPRIAIELDGYFHFLATENYRRDRTKDWELQKQGYIVLRFLSEDVVRHLDIIRDRILETLSSTSCEIPRSLQTVPLCSVQRESSNHAPDGNCGGADDGI